MAKNEKHHLVKRGDVWYFVATHRGKRYHEPLSSNLREARRTRDNYLLELQRFGSLTNQVENDLPKAEGMLLGEVAEMWIKIQETRVEKNELKDSSLRDYRSSMNLHILPVFGNMPINSIETYHVDDFVLSLNCSGKRKKNILAPLKSLFKMAIKRKLVQDNIMEKLDKITVEKTEIFPFSVEEVARFLECTPEHYTPFFTTLFFTGMRFGEVAGLKWDNVDFNRGVIRICETRVYGKEGRVKTTDSKREVVMLPPVTEALLRQQEMGLSGRYVFKDRVGACMTPDHIREVIWKPILENAGLKYRPPRQTRHTFATLAIDSGESLSWVMQMLGHSSLQMIYTVYYKWIKRKDDGNAMMTSLSNSFSELAVAV
jgi:integrase